jgi:hypothetical protein
MTMKREIAARPGTCAEAADRIRRGADRAHFDAMGNRNAQIALVLLGVALLAAGAIYLTQPAGDLPSFLPGHEAGSSHHHVKHGIAALALGLGAFVLAWFQSGPRDKGAPEG